MSMQAGNIQETLAPVSSPAASAPAVPAPGGVTPAHLAAGLIFVIAAAAFAMMQVTGLPHAPVVILASVVAAYMALNIGANDVANNVGPAVGSGALTMVGALVMAAVFEAAGALIAGGDVVDTISKGIIDPRTIPDSGSFIRVMLAALLAAAIWINLATYVGAPISTTHSIVGGVLGAGLAAGGMSSANWAVMGKIAASWVVSPVLGAAVAALVLVGIKAAILYRQDRVAAAKKWVPVLVGILGATFSAYLIMKGLKRVWRPDAVTIVALSLAGYWLVYVIVRPIVAVAAKTMENTRDSVNGLFTIPLICAAALLCFAHGSNDVANAIGPLAAIVHSATENGIAAKVSLPEWVILVGAVGLAVGLLVFGAKMVRRVGSEITEIDRVRAFAVALSASVTVILASALGLPVSTTHVAVGAVFGVGFLREYLVNEADKVRAIRELFNDNDEPNLFCTARSEMKRWRDTLECLATDRRFQPRESHYSGLTSRAEALLESWEHKKLVRRSLLGTIVMAWLITVPTTACIAGLVYLALASVQLPGLS